jgi:hypothetical protein
MNAPDFTVIRTTRTAIEADLMIAALRSSGLNPRDLETMSHFSLAGADVSYYVEVPASEVAAAKELLRGHES